MNVKINFVLAAYVPITRLPIVWIIPYGPRWNR